MSHIRKKKWPVYLCGIFIGCLQLPLFLLLDKTISASGGFEVLSDYILDTLFVSVPREYGSSMTWWSTCLLVGSMLGAWISSKLSKKQSSNLATFWADYSVGHSFFGRCVKGFIGGFCIILGARVAGGCSIGQGLAGIAKLQLSSLLVMFVVLITALIVAYLMYRDN